MHAPLAPSPLPPPKTSMLARAEPTPSIEASVLAWLEQQR